VFGSEANDFFIYFFVICAPEFEQRQYLSSLVMGCCAKGDKNTHQRHLINLASPKFEGELGIAEDGGRLDLKKHVRNRLFKEIFDEGINARQRAPKKSEQRVRSFGLYALIVDDMGAEIFNSCVRMTELGQRRVAVVEKLELQRKPLKNMEAIYVMRPDEDSVRKLIEDFPEPRSALYKCAHIFFTRKIDTIHFDAICQSPIGPFIKTMKEIYVAFIPEGSQVFNLNMKHNLTDLYSPTTHPSVTQKAVDIMTEKILSLCQTLNLYPKIRYQSSLKATNTALHLSRKLGTYNRSVEGNLSRSRPPGENVLLVLERSVDIPTVLLHPLTLEAFVHDVLPVEKGVYESTLKTAHGEEIKELVKLDEQDDNIWRDIRHLHIADAATSLPKKQKDFLENHHLMSHNDPNIADMSQILRDFPEYQKEFCQFSRHMELLAKCVDRMKMTSSLYHTVVAEQNIARGVNGHTQKPIKSMMHELAPLLTDEDMDEMSKMRLIMLYVLLKDGAPESDIDKIFESAELPLKYKGLVINMSFLGLNIITRRQKCANRPPVKERPPTGRFVDDRWIPYVADLLDGIFSGTMSRHSFPSIKKEEHNTNKTKKLHNDDGELDREHHHHPRVKRIIVVFIGGVTYAEMQVAHQFAADKGVDVLIGGDDIITAPSFMKRIRKLNQWSENSLHGRATQTSRFVFVGENLNREDKNSAKEQAGVPSDNELEHHASVDFLSTRDSAAAARSCLQDSRERSGFLDASTHHY